MNTKRVKRIVFLMVICLLLGTVLGSCSIGGRNEVPSDQNTADDPPQSEDPEEESITMTMSEAREMANRSSSLWEMMCNMFPNYVVYKSSGLGFTFAAINEELPLNTYDWTKTSKAMRGIDVSAYQKKVDWEKVAADNVQFVFLRLGYRGWGTGALTKDERFDYNAQNSTANGIPTGVYFVTKAINTDEAREEAEWIIAQIEPYDITWPIVMDFESAKDDRDRTYYLTAEERTEIIIEFCETLKAAGYTPMLYGGVGTYMTKMDINRLGDYCKWFAQYFNAPHFPYKFQIWQATDSGSIDGISGNVDIDYAFFNFTDGTDVIRTEDADK